MYITMPAPIRGVCTLQTDMVSFTVLFELAGGSLFVHYTPCIEGDNKIQIQPERALAAMIQYNLDAGQLCASHCY